VLVDRRPLPRTTWSFNPSTGVLRAHIEGENVRVEALACVP